MAHLHEKIDFTASVFIVREGKVLLHFHKKSGKWLQPGGHIELDEDPVMAAVREAKEETGFDLEVVSGPMPAGLETDPTNIAPPRFVNRHRFNDTHEHVDLVYFARVTGGEFRSEDGAETHWLSAEDIARDAVPLVPSVRAYALAALAELS